MMDVDIWTAKWVVTAAVLIVVITLWIVLDRSCVR